MINTTIAKAIQEWQPTHKSLFDLKECIVTTLPKSIDELVDDPITEPLIPILQGENLIGWISIVPPGQEAHAVWIQIYEYQMILCVQPAVYQIYNEQKKLNAPGWAKKVTEETLLEQLKIYDENCTENNLHTWEFYGFQLLKNGELCILKQMDIFNDITELHTYIAQVVLQITTDDESFESLTTIALYGNAISVFDPTDSIRWQTITQHEDMPEISKGFHIKGNKGELFALPITKGGWLVLYHEKDARYPNRYKKLDSIKSIENEVIAILEHGKNEITTNWFLLGEIQLAGNMTN